MYRASRILFLRREQREVIGHRLRQHLFALRQLALVLAPDTPLKTLALNAFRSFKRVF
ncbi:MAG: hypothetical protein ING75_05725 [Rhodocyclaceae bacterium]|nr:hypothetical protein [Rhodocyclaceae bacterium]